MFVLFCFVCVFVCVFLFVCFCFFLLCFVCVCVCVFVLLCFALFCFVLLCFALFCFVSFFLCFFGTIAHQLFASHMHYTTVTTGDLALASRKKKHVCLTRPHPPRHSRRHGHTDQDGRQCMPTNDRFGTSEMDVFAHLRRPHGYLIQSDWFSDHGLSILLPDTPKQVYKKKSNKNNILSSP